MASTDSSKPGSISPFGLARSTVTGSPLSKEELEITDQYFRASLYLCVGMLYLKENPLLSEQLKVEHLKTRLLGKPLQSSVSTTAPYLTSWIQQGTGAQTRANASPGSILID